MFIINNPSFGKGYLSTYKDYNLIVTHCEEFYDLMRRRRAACTKSLLEIYNPRRKWQLKPHHKARKKYCSKITKLKNPYTWCTKKCGNVKLTNWCKLKRNQCTCILNKWLRNNRGLMSGDRTTFTCQPLPEGTKKMPEEDSPLNNIVVCGRKSCDYILGSELPWCPIEVNNKASGRRENRLNTRTSKAPSYVQISERGATVEQGFPSFHNLSSGHICAGSGCHNKTHTVDTFEHSNYGSGNEQFQAWTDGKGSCNLCRCDNGTPAWGDICPKENEIKCEACHFGYHLEIQRV